MKVAIVAASAALRAELAAMFPAPEFDVVSDAAFADVVVLGDGRPPRAEVPITHAVLLGDENSLPALRRLNLGGWGIVPPNADKSELQTAVRAAAQGYALMPARALEARLPAQPSPDTEVALTPRELEILERVSRGLPNKAIAFELGISENTVKFHMAAILEKLNAASRAEAVSIAARLGLLML
ncbi:MAG TPA: response regulator transcription factor [Thermoflexales bacterium]|nr:response regulator transcription factor [Thermoflexales bacterium]HQW36181.1 response regulator transcription factor [Thermoflexales bacterium]HRA00458.1 response regulator transcription factor [Thermoflexales bacterium]